MSAGAHPPLPPDPLGQGYVGWRRVASAEQMRRIDSQAVAQGVPAEVLMENAGRAASRAVLRWLAVAHRDSRAQVLLLCGPGNNGGDGFCMARTLHHWGQRVALVSLAAPNPGLKASPEFRLHHELCLQASRTAPFSWCALGAAMHSGPPGAQLWGEFQRLLGDSVLVVDALFGTGLSRPIAEPMARALQEVAHSGLPVLAIDLPSGLDADDGRLWGPAPKAVGTITFGAWKRGLLSGAGPGLAGAVEVVEIGLPVALVEQLEALGGGA